MHACIAEAKPGAPVSNAIRAYARKLEGEKVLAKGGLEALKKEIEALVEEEARAGGPGALDKRPVVIHK